MEFSRDIKTKVANLPDLPGVYLMKNAKSTIIYVGKAKNLKNRVSQYFRTDKNHAEKVKKMVENVEDFEYIITGSEYEALVLECNLIKHYSPKYNILLKDDKGYCYVKITNEKWPRLVFSGTKADDGSKYLGPYMSSWYTKKSLENATKIFKLPICNRNFEKRSRPCLNYHIGQCDAPCAGKISLKTYKENFEEAVSFLKSGDKQIIKTLTQRMNEAAENLEFEKAAKIRDKIKAIKNSMNKQKVILDDERSQDVIAFAETFDKTCVGVLRFEAGKLYKSENFIVDRNENTASLRANFVKSYYSMKENVPDKVLFDGEIEEADLIAKWLSEKKGDNVKIYFSSAGKNHRIIEMCRNNAFEYIMQKMHKKSSFAVLEDLKNLLSLEVLPKYIEAYDISNIQGSENVGAMVVFKDAKPFKSAYKKFKIKYISGQDDYGSMLEIISRRFDEYTLASAKSSSEKAEFGFAKKPDLVLIDGGATHAGMVKEYLEKAGFAEIPVFGMVKDGKHRTRALTNENCEISIKSNEKLFQFITRIQDEVHRFAITYHHKRRGQTMFSSELQNIDGIGKKRADMLLKHFKSPERIALASPEELCLLPGMTKPAAQAIFDFFKLKSTQKVTNE